jgi:hypothetical protein
MTQGELVWIKYCCCCVTPLAGFRRGNYMQEIDMVQGCTINSFCLERAQPGQQATESAS